MTQPQTVEVQKKENYRFYIGLGDCPSPADYGHKVVPMFGKYGSMLIYNKKERELQEFTDSCRSRLVS